VPNDLTAQGVLGLLSKNWWLILLRGILAVVFGVLAFAWPGITIAVLVIWFGAYALVDGIFILIAAIAGWKHLEHRWLLVLEGLVGIWAGLITFRMPELTAAALLLLIAGWSLAMGVLRIITAVRLRKEIEGELWMILSGIVSIAFAFVVLWLPVASAVALIYMLGCFAIALGMAWVLVAFKLRGRLKKA
jgi:uncharacterized membrane protein HdeD (DUF308 family)